MSGGLLEKNLAIRTAGTPTLSNKDNEIRV
jgi:hypothetical protein